MPENFFKKTLTFFGFLKNDADILVKKNKHNGHFKKKPLDIEYKS